MSRRSGGSRNSRRPPRRSRSRRTPGRNCSWPRRPADETEKLAAINRVRALTNIAPLVGPVTDDIIIEERRRQLFSEGQRYVDMLRKKLPFQSGTNRKGQTYSDLTCIPLPDVETQNNPNLKG